MTIDEIYEAIKNETCIKSYKMKKKQIIQNIVDMEWNLLLN